MALPQKKERKILTSKTINIIRTTQRNNIDLTAIADNKANVLLSLNALMLTFIIPFAFTNVDMIFEKYLYLPLAIVCTTSFLTIYQSAQVLKPSDFDRKRNGTNPDVKPSPFFFGNFYKMSSKEYYKYLQEGLADDNLIKAHLAQDLFYIGRRLGDKMSKIRSAFNIFLIGIFLTLLTTAFILLFV